MWVPAMLVAAALAPAPAPAAPAAAPAVQESAGSADDHIRAGIPEFRRRRFAAALRHFEQAVAADPSSAAAHFYLGYTIYKIAEPKRPFHPEKQKAAEHFARAYELDPTFRPVWAQ